MRILSLAAVVVALLQPMSANTAWTVCNRKLLKDGNLFFIRGVNYQPVPIGGWSGVDLLLQPALWQRDLALLRNMNVNAAKVYFMAPGNAKGHQAYLDAAFNNGYLPIFTMFSIWVTPQSMVGSVQVTDAAFQSIIAQYYLMAKEVACHPGTMGFVIGGEMNGIWDVQTQPFWAKFNALSQAVRSGIAAATCASPAPKILTTNFLDDYASSIAYGEQFGADVDVWGVNIYDKRFDASKMLQYNRVTSRPYLFSEYGVPFGSNEWEAAGPYDAWNVGLYLLSMAQLLRKSFLGKDPSGTSVLVGGFIFEYTDEWWKEGFPWRHDYSPVPAQIFPLQFGSEEYYGLFTISPGNGLNTVTPRAVVAQLAALWAEPIDGQAYNCANPVPPTAPATPLTTAVTACGRDAAAGIASFSDPGVCGSANSGLGCQGSGPCRYCQLLPTAKSAPYVGCPAPPPPPPPAACANSSRICPNGVALLPTASCTFDACPSMTCNADPVMLQRGVGMFYDSVCAGSNIASLVGCDLLRPGCRYCTPPYGQTAFVPCPVVLSSTPCIATVSNLNMGLGLVSDPSCVGGGVGCDATRPSCRYCMMFVTPQSAQLRPCPGVTIADASGFAAVDDGGSGDAKDNPSATSTMTTAGLLVLGTVFGLVAVGVAVAKVRRRADDEKKDLALRTPTDPNIL
ncbi:Aste57867_21652 [Aphanomyces stellatus]|uniref:Aste57867_21652 protein n=1 Tax=Aphanomyces stellatus TaxID=120398 RepID=A0A485LI32_9STRA|nr:hypothetical protein As57867_021583 [Aphanomyces stellatus]VFT98321.1 Aste57867_21652 [Aphanomyces stellatus]